MLRKTGLSLAIASAIGLSGCFGGSSDDDPAPSSSVVSGTASKGIIVNGRVRAYLFNENGTRASSAIASAITNAEGEYSLSIPSRHRGQPLFIEIDYNNGLATMRCDLASGCAEDVAFGEDYDLDDRDFSLSAVIPDSSGVVTTNLTPLTTVAALKALDEIGAAGSNFAAAVEIAQANSSVAASIRDILGIDISDITEIEVIDLTDADEVAASVEDSVALRVAAFNAALVSAAQNDSATPISIEDALAAFSSQMAANQLSYDAGESDDTDVTEILNQLDAVLDASIQNAIDQLDPDESGDLVEAIESEGGLLDLIAEAFDNAANDDDGLVDATPSQTAGSEELVQAKAFVEELRKLGTVINDPFNADPTISEIVDSFELQAEAADFASSEEVRLSAEALGQAVSAMVAAYKENFDLETGELTEGAEDSFEVDGITVTFESVNDAMTLSVVQDIAVEGFETPAAVDITATVANIAISEVPANESAEIDLTILGSAEAGTTVLSVDQGSRASGTLTSQVTVGNSGAQTVYQLTDLGLTLRGTIAQIPSESIPDPMTFSGGFDFDIDVAQRTENSSGATTTIGVVGFSLDGTFSKSEESFDAEFSLTADATGVTFQDVFNLESGVDLSDLDDNETESNFVNVEADLLFDAELSEITSGSEVAFDIHLERTGYNDLSSDIELHYPGFLIEINAELNNIKTSQFSSTFTFSNVDDGVVITITRNASGMTGTVEVDDVVYGRLGGTTSVPTIAYSDGTFVSLF